MAAQNQMTALKSAGALKELGGASISQKPQDFEEEDSTSEPGEAPPDWNSVKDDYFYLSHSAGSADPAGLTTLLPQNAIESHLWEHNFVVEYNQKTGQVYGVFYGEVSFTYQQLQNLSSRNRDDLKTLPVGYYGGSDVTVPDLNVIDPGEIEVENNEVLALRITPVNSTGTSAPVNYDVTVTGNTSKQTAEFKDITRSTDINIKKDNGSYLLILDELSVSLHFQDQFPDFIPGEDITLSVTAYSKDGNAQEQSKKLVSNSLFASRDEQEVQIAWGRHLQNLESSVSGVDNEVTQARQILPIDWNYYNEKKTVFKPITNGHLTSYQGKLLAIQNLKIGINDKDSGLFGSFTGETLNEICLVNAKTANKDKHDENNAQYAGLLAGRVTLKGAESGVTGCLAYAEVTDNNEAERFEKACFLKNTGTGYVGGLIGEMTGNMSACAAAVPLIEAKDATVGGLVGSFSGTATTSYANTGALTGKTVGGFAGDTTAASTFDNCYALGLLQGVTKTAGFCPSKAHYSFCYSAATYANDLKGVIGLVPAGEPGEHIVDEHCYYLFTGKQAFGVSAGEQVSDLNKLLDHTDSKVWTSAIPKTTHPYYFGNNQTYPYPALKGNDHYGDWPVLAKDAMLVYYEKYNDGTYGLDDGQNMVQYPLSDEKPILSDGYALLIALPGAFTVAFDDTSVEPLPTGQTIPVNGKDYTLYLLPETVLKSQPGSNFYHKVTYNGTANLYCNPHFAKSALNGLSSAPPSGYTDYTAIVRTPRHLYNLGHENAYWTMTLKQELNIDCGGTYPHTDRGPYLPAGTKENPSDDTEEIPFTGAYNGNGKTISRFTTSGDLAGLFGFTKNASLSGIYLVDPSITGNNMAGSLVAQAETTKIDNCRAYLSTDVDKFNDKNESYASVRTTGTGSLAGGLIGQGKSCPVTQSFAALQTRSSGEAGGFAGSLTSGTVNTCYASGDVSGAGGVGGFVGKTEKASQITNSYSSADVEGGAGSGGFVGTSSDTFLSHCYACGMVSIPKQAPDTVGGFYGKESTFSLLNMPTKCSYLSQTGHNDGLTLSQFPVGAVAYSALLYTGTAQTSHPYSPTLTGQQYPFSPAGSLPHYADWPQERDKYSATLVYYERYATEDPTTHSFYGFYAGTSLSAATTTWALDTLRDETCVEDGYAVLTEYKLSSFAYTLDDESGKLIQDSIDVGMEDQAGTAQVLLSGQTVSFMSGDYVKYVVRNAYIYRLPFALQEVSRSAASSFYVELKLSGTKAEDGTSAFADNVFYYCPHFARTAVNPILGQMAATRPDNPKDVYVRSARQLNALGRYTYYWNNYKNKKFAPYYFHQETDISFSTYAQQPNGPPRYCGEIFEMCVQYDHSKPAKNPYANRPIGMPATELSGSVGSALGQFQCTYDGQGNRIIDYYVDANVQFVGLFGEIANAELKNIVMCVSQDWPDQNYGKIINRYTASHPGTGGLVGLIYSKYKTSGNNAVLIDQSKISVDNCSVSGYTVRHTAKCSDKYVAAGGLAGYNMGTIQSSSAVSKQVSIEQPGSRRYLGGLVGDNSGTVKNCYAGGTLMLAGTNTGANASYIGGLIGVCGDYITGADATKQNARLVENCYAYCTILDKTNSKVYAHSGITYLGSNTAKKDFTIQNCYYLKDLLQVEPIYKNDKTYSYDNLKSGDPCTYGQMADTSFLSTLNQNGSDRFQSVIEAGCSYYSVGLTPATKNYPFPAVVTRTVMVPVLDDNGQETGNTNDVLQYIHYGDWPDAPDEPDKPKDTPKASIGVFQWYEDKDGASPLYYAGNSLLYNTEDNTSGNLSGEKGTDTPAFGILFDNLSTEELSRWRVTYKSFTYPDNQKLDISKNAQVSPENATGYHLVDIPLDQNDTLNSITFAYNGDENYYTYTFSYVATSNTFSFSGSTVTPITGGGDT